MSPRAKLPHKFRQQVSRLRSQFALVSNPASSVSSKSGKTVHQANGVDANASPTHGLQSSPGSRVPKTSSPGPHGLASEPRYSSQSQKMQTLQSQLSMLRKSTRSMVKSTVVTGEKAGGGDDDDGSMSSSPVREQDVVSFFDLLRPLQNSLSCARLISEWSSSDEDEEDDTSNGQTNAKSGGPSPLRQPERDRSPMLRICCSLDNLLLSIGDQVQEEKENGAIARGAARELLQLFQFAIKQVAATTSATDADCFSSDIGSSSNNGTGGLVAHERKELQYMQEFLTELTERMGKLDHFVRSTLVSEIDGLHDQTGFLEQEVSNLTQLNTQLRTELSDLRDFYSQSNPSSLVFGRSFPTDSSDLRLGGGNQAGCDERDETSKRMASLFPTLDAAKASSAAVDEVQQLRGQCEELTRLLEMAKQEIRFCHHESEVQNNRLAELSSALFKDQEMAALRNQLLSEKKRVKNLEIENVSLRENQLDQSMKIQSLLVNGAECASSTQGAANGSTASRISSETAPASSLVPSDPVVKAQATNSPVGSGSGDRDGGRAANTDNRQKGSETPPSSPHRTNQSAGTANANGGEDAEAKLVWFYHMVGLSSQQLETISRTKHQPAELDVEPGSSPLSQQKQFLSSLLMTEKQIASSVAQSKVRRQGNVPTITPPLATLPGGARISVDEKARNNAKKKRPASAGKGETPDTHEDLQDVVVACRQIIWFFYQRFLMAEEASTLLPRSQYSSMHKASLASVVLHFFFERKPREDDALLDAALFVKCLHQVRDEAGDIRFFCDFLEGTRSRDELCFFLWVLQVTEDTSIGIAYDVPLTANGNEKKDRSKASLPHICAFKATFLTRFIYRLFHFKALRCSPPATATSGKPSSTSLLSTRSNTSMKETSASTTSSPRKKRKSRTGEEDLKSTLRSSPSSISVAPPSQKKSLLDHVKACFLSAIALNNGFPLTIEAFNSLLMQFAVTPSTEELSVRLGPFFRPSGDEKKLSSEVYLALLMEMYAYQLEWRKKQLRNLFITLARHFEVDELARQQESNAAQQEVAASKGKRSSTKLEKSKPLKPPKAKKKKKKSCEDRDSSDSKHLKGLTRTLLRQFLLQSGIVADALHVDIDALFVQILEMTHRSAATIHFDELYDVLMQLDWLGNRDFQVDATTSVFNQQWHSTGDESKLKMLASLRYAWSTQAKQSLTLCESDPNVFVRRHARMLSTTIDHYLKTPTSPGNTPTIVPPSNHHFWHSLQRIRDFLGFSWRTAAKRAGEFQTKQAENTPCEKQVAPHWYVSEFFYLNRALCVLEDFPGYQNADTLLLESGSTEFAHAKHQNSDPSPARARDLHSFWDTSRMQIDDLFASSLSINNSSESPALKDKQGGDQHEPVMRQELEHVLLRFSFHIAHLFASFTGPRFNFSGLTLREWLRMARELGREDKTFPGSNEARDLFYHVYTLRCSSEPHNGGEGQLHDVCISKSQFVALLVRVACAKYLVAQKKKEHKMLRSRPKMLRPAQIMSDFCHDVVVPAAFRPRDRQQEVDFTKRLSCPLVCRVLLEHRSFLRLVFFFYAKLDDDEQQREDAEQRPEVGETNDRTKLALQDPALHGFRLSKTKRNSMRFDEFLAFLVEFELLASSSGSKSEKVFSFQFDIEKAQLVFCSVMSLENADTSQMEFDEFAAAVAALAVFRDPDPFRLWHAKIDLFVQDLQRVAKRKELRFD